MAQNNRTFLHCIHVGVDVYFGRFYRTIGAGARKETLAGTGLEELRARWAGGPEAWAEGLVALEMAGLIRRLPGGIIARRLWRP